MMEFIACVCAITFLSAVGSLVSLGVTAMNLPLWVAVTVGILAVSFIMYLISFKK